VQLNWIPNGAAKALASQRSRTVGALIPTLGHQNFATLVECLQEELTDAGCTLLLGCAAFSAERETQQAAKMIERGVDCIVLLGHSHAPTLYELLAAHKTPYLITYTSGEPGETNCVGFDNYAAFSNLVRHLLDLGHRNFGLIAQSSEGNDRVARRIDAMRDLLAQEGIAVRPQHFISTPNWSLPVGRKAFATVMSHDPKPTAIVCTNDYLAAGALIEAKHSGISVPEDVSIAGFDDIDLSAHLDPPLTTVRVPDREMGREAAKYIISVVNGVMPETPPTLNAELILRKSTAPPKGR
jgi:LacI family transcriptional regulator